jgi:hypothetical protein
MKNRLVLLVILAASMLSLPALAAKSYYYVVTSTTGTATFGPFQSLGECQEALAKMQGKFPKMQTNGCFLK